MAILGKIRKQTGLLVITIGVAMLAFVAGDLFSENSFLRRMFTGDPNEVGSINGSSITLAEYLNAQSSMRSNQNMSANQVSQNIWNTIVSQKITSEHAEKAGLEVSDDEVWDYIAKQYGMQNAGELKTQIGQLKSQAEQGVPNAGAMYNNFMNTFNETKPSLLNQKYLELVNAATLVSNEEAKFQQAANIQNASFEYAYVSYEDLEKKFKVEVTDSEIEAYMKKFPKYYEQEASADISFVYFPSQPSKDDENTVLNSIKKYLTPSISVDEINNITDSIPAFASVKDDSAYVTKYSDVPFNDRYITKSELEKFAPQLPEDYADFLLNAKQGEVGGPFKIGESYQLVKISKGKEVADSINSSHILITYKGTDVASRDNSITRTRDEAKVLADSLLNVANANPSNFKALVEKYSDDAGSKEKGGNIGWQGANTQGLAAEYLKFLNEHKTGEIGLTESQFGYHIIKIDGEKTQMGHQIAIILKELKPSQETSDKNFADARTFAQEVQGKSLNDFANLAQKKGFNYNTTDGVTRFYTQPIVDPSSGFGNDKDEDIMKWVFNKGTKPGSSALFTTINEDQIIVFVKQKYPKGLKPASAAREEIEPIIKHKKLTDKINTDLGGKPKLEDIVTKYGGTVGNASTTFVAAKIEGRQNAENRVAGAAFGLKPGTSSKAIEGTDGVFVINLVSKGEKPEVADAEFLIQQLSDQQKQNISQQLVPSIIRASDIKDFRSERLDRSQPQM